MELSGKEQIEEQFTNYIYLFTIINEFVNLSSKIYFEEISNNSQDDKIRDNILKRTFHDEANLLINISKLEINDENLIKNRKEKIYKFLELKDDNKTKIIDKINNKFQEMSKLLNDNTLLEELMGKIFKYFSMTMNSLIFKLFNQINYMNNKMEIMQKDMNNMKNKFEEMEEMVKMLEKQSKEKDAKIEIINQNFIEQILNINEKLEEKGKKIYELENKINTINLKFNELKKMTQKLIEKENDMTTIYQEKKEIISNILNIINN